MEFFIIVAVLVLAGIGYVFWLLKNDDSDDSDKVNKLIPDHLFNPDKNVEIDLRPPTEPPLENKKSKSIKFDLKQILPSKDSPKPSEFDALEKIGSDEKKPSSKKPFGGFFNKPKKKEPQIIEDDILSLTLKEQLGLNQSKNPPPLKPSTTGTTSIKINPAEEKSTPIPKSFLSTEEQKTVENDVNTSLELTDLKNKYQRQEKILKERTDELEKIKHDWEQEINHRKEFNKIKDLLEKELADMKDKSRKAHNEVITAKTESEGYQKRIKQLEEKIQTLEKKIYEQEKSQENPSKGPWTDKPSSVTPEVSLPKTSIETPTNPVEIKNENQNPEIETSENEPPSFLSLKPDVLGENNQKEPNL